MRFINTLLAVLPKVSVGLDDGYLYVSVGDDRHVGFTVGRHFLSLDVDGDIAHQLISPPADYVEPMSDFTFAWDSREGLTHLHVPAVNHRSPSAGADYVSTFPTCEEECEPSTVRGHRAAGYVGVFQQ